MSDNGDGMSNSDFLFKDYINMPETTKYFSDAQNLLQDFQNSSTEHALRVTIRATHSGYLLNGRVYPGTAVRDGASSWLSKKRGGTAGYDKPFLTHHDEHGEPVGRVDYQQFVQLKQGNDFDDDWRMPESGTEPGSGFILLSGTIGDKEAQHKILDGRYNTVSTGQATNRAHCSICGENWLGQDAHGCEHSVGQTYEVEGNDYLAYLVTGTLNYRECSFVNVPANEIAQVVGASVTDGSPSDILAAKSWDSADDNSMVCSVSILDSAGRSTELIRGGRQDDTINFGADSARPKVLIAVPPTFDVGGTGNDNMSKEDIQDVTEEAATSETDSATTEQEEVLSKVVESMGIEADSDENLEEVIAESAKAEVTNDSDDSEAQISDEADATEVADCGDADVCNTEDADSESVTDNPEEGDTMQEDNVASDTSDLDEVLQTALKDAQSRLGELESEVARQKSLYDSKVQEYNKVLDENAVLAADLRDQLARQLCTVQIQLGKPSVSSVEDAASFEKQVLKVAKRSVDSLKDSIADLIPELSQSFAKDGLPAFVQDKPEPKPATQKVVKDESKKPSKSADSSNPNNLL